VEEQSLYQVFLRRKSPDPTPWLSEYQEKFGEASKIAAEETSSLSGYARQKEMRRLIACMMKR
jgi:hypothetical protein